MPSGANDWTDAGVVAQAAGLAVGVEPGAEEDEGPPLRLLRPHQLDDAAGG